MAVDYYDLIWQSEELFDEQHIDRFLGECAGRGINAIQWRLSVCGQLLYHTRTGDMFTGKKYNSQTSIAKAHETTYYKCKTILRQFDPLETAIRLSHKHGLKLYPWLTLYDDYGILGDRQSSIVANYPNMSWSSIDNRNHYLGVLSYAYPEVVEFRLRQIREILSYGGDGIYLCNRSHSRPPEYNIALEDFTIRNPDTSYIQWIAANTEFIEKAQKTAIGKFGFDPPAVAAYIQATGMPPENSPEWWNFRGQYFTKFMKQVRKEVSGKLAFGLRYEPNHPHFIYGNYFFNWAELLNGDILDELHYAMPEDESPHLMMLFPELFTSALTSKQGWCWLGHKKLTDTVKYKANIIKKCLNQGNLDGVTLFEAYHFIQKPDFWELLDYFKQ